MSATSSETPSTTEPPAPSLRPKPKRADARRNYDAILLAARTAFAERGAGTSLEEIARRAEVGIGTLYRHFPTRQALLEAVYVDEVEALSRSATELADVEPWEALRAWLSRFVAYLATKRALADELLEYHDTSSPLFRECRALMHGAGGPIVERAQAAGVVRPDTDVAEITQMVMGIARIPAADPATVGHMLEIALDGLRFRG